MGSGDGVFLGFYCSVYRCGSANGFEEALCIFPTCEAVIQKIFKPLPIKSLTE